MASERLTACAEGLRAVYCDGLADALDYLNRESALLSDESAVRIAAEVAHIRVAILHLARWRDRRAAQCPRLSGQPE
jgi:hypothetical protein